MAWLVPGPARGEKLQQNLRDRHIQLIAEKGRMAWQKATGYGRRSLVETAIGRYKHIIGSTLRARSNDGQGGEVCKTACKTFQIPGVNSVQ
jgi:hypothetical protein